MDQIIERRHERKESKGMFRIFTSVTNAPYTVNVGDVSKKGAFIKTKYLPEVGETITFLVLDNYGIERYVGNAKVVWRREREYDGDLGFGIELETELVDEVLEDLIVQ